MSATKLGTGYLSWPAGERRSDRYGCVLLAKRPDDCTFSATAPADSDQYVAFDGFDELVGKRRTTCRTKFVSKDNSEPEMCSEDV